ncbi:hypothetical protein L3C95_11265 [Chitinophaga filiformis]|uniref:hypothetical protein n=1 Tax=Chitinophaga filiformis TaxID=104663 RepID=UPI001F45D711|nr:hypothetical protein [Chitinophaga filiformis]MCF6402623.1 hypothetical protein [Chitinophaga filiformis]MCF6403459.1 hypothetical protein [Chitinophaga filiformis]
MKRISSYFFVACMFSLMIGIASCGKDGAAGPAGPAGANGPKGDKGDKGDQGDPGSVNITYSEWLDTQFALDTASGEYVWGVDVEAIDAELLSTGFVKVYFNLYTAAQPNISSVPYVEGDLYIREVLTEGGLLLFSNFNVSTQTDNNGNKRFQVRYVIVPGNVAARGRSIDWTKYAEVQALLGIKN